MEAIRAKPFFRMIDRTLTSKPATRQRLEPAGMKKTAYPDKSYLRDVVLRHFADIGCDEEAGADLVCFAQDSGIRWVIEIVGEANADGNAESRVRAGLGNLLTRMDFGPEAHYVLVTPDFPEYVTARENVPAWTLRALNLFWYVVDAQGEIHSITPFQSVRHS